MVTEVQQFFADNDASKTAFTTFAAASDYEMRLNIVRNIEDHLEGVYGKRVELHDIGLSDWLEVVNIVERDMRPQHSHGELEDLL